MEKFVVITYLFDFYQELLTEKQKELVKEYYFEDLSLSEMSERHEISRQSAFDTIKKAEQKMLDYESKLGLFVKYQKEQSLLLSIKEKCEETEKSLEGETAKKMQEVISLVDGLLNKM